MGKIRRITIYSKKILKDKKLLLVSDIHHELDMKDNHLKQLKETLKDEFKEMNYIVIPGDIINKATDLLDSSYQKECQDELKEFIEDKKTIFSPGNHDQINLTKTKDIIDEDLIYEFLEKTPNIKALKNGEKISCEEITFSAFTPKSNYYTELKENMYEYKKEFYETYNEALFNKEDYNIFLTHEPQSIIKLSEINGKCIQENTDLVVSGHMHNGLLPNLFHKMFKNRGLLSPQMELFPKFAQGTYQVEDTKFIINGPVNTRVETPFINKLYGYNATIIDLKQEKTLVKH